LPSGFEFLGYLWIPAMLVGYYIVYRNPPKTMPELAQKAVLLLLIFFLTRTWLSEPNLNLLVVLALSALVSVKLDLRNYGFLWVIPLFFMLFNTSLPQLFFLVQPSIIPYLAQLDQSIRLWRLIGKFVVALVWQAFAWRLVFRLVNKEKEMQLTF